jgi:hypothetical protein
MGTPTWAGGGAFGRRRNSTTPWRGRLDRTIVNLDALIARDR